MCMSFRLFDELKLQHELELAASQLVSQSAHEHFFSQLDWNSLQKSKRLD
jgi:hypothetical protein